MSGEEMPFEKVGSKGDIQNNISSHLNFIKCISDKAILNELLNRFEHQFIVSDIQNKRDMYPTLDKNILLKSVVSPFSNKYGPSLYINYINKNNIQIFHATFHLCPDSLDKKSNGLLHFKQNNNRNKTMKKRTGSGKPMRICESPKSTNSIWFCLSTNPNYTIKVPFEKEAECILDVLNEYFDKNNNKYLGIPYNSKTKHKYSKQIYKNIMNSVQKLNSTKRSKR